MFPFLITSAYLPMLSLMSVACIGLLLGRTRGTLYGMIAGLIIDITVSTPLGVMTLLYAATGFVCGVGAGNSSDMWSRPSWRRWCAFWDIERS